MAPGRALMLPPAATTVFGPGAIDPYGPRRVVPVDLSDGPGAGRPRQPSVPIGSPC